MKLSATLESYLTGHSLTHKSYGVLLLPAYKRLFGNDTSALIEELNYIHNLSGPRFNFWIPGFNEINNRENIEVISHSGGNLKTTNPLPGGYEFSISSISQARKDINRTYGVSVNAKLNSFMFIEDESILIKKIQALGDIRKLGNKILKISNTNER